MGGSGGYITAVAGTETEEALGMRSCAHPSCIRFEGPNKMARGGRRHSDSAGTAPCCHRLQPLMDGLDHVPDHLEVEEGAFQPARKHGRSQRRRP